MPTPNWLFLRGPPHAGPAVSVRLESAPLVRHGLVLARLSPVLCAPLQPPSPLRPLLPPSHSPQQRPLKTHSSSQPRRASGSLLTALSKLPRNRPFAIHRPLSAGALPIEI